MLYFLIAVEAIYKSSIPGKSFGGICMIWAHEDILVCNPSLSWLQSTKAGFGLRLRASSVNLLLNTNDME